MRPLGSLALAAALSLLCIGNPCAQEWTAQTLRNDTDSLRDEIQKHESKSGHALPNAALAAEKIEQVVSRIETGYIRLDDAREFLKKAFADAKNFAQIEEAGKDPWLGKTGYIERAYESRIDNGPQPYFVMVPSIFAKPDDANAPKKYPLVVFLHGYVGRYDKLRWWEEATEFNVLFEKNNAFLAIPFGRSNTDFQGCGEVDVLDVIAEMKRLYPIDDTRIYLYGYSMGGMGVYTIGAHYPDLFAGGIVLAGRADNYLLHNQPLSKLPAYKSWLIQADNPVSLCENFLNFPLRIYHNDQDFIINVEEARRMEKRFAELGCDAKLSVISGDHDCGVDVLLSDAPIKWLLTHQRADAAPKRHMKAFNLRHAKQGEIQVTAVSGALQPIDLEWTNKAGNLEFTADSPVVVQRRVKDRLIPATLAGLTKSPERCGPVREATCGPFTIVYGTSGSPAANAENKKKAIRFANEWYIFTKSIPAIKADNEITDADKKTRNLFLFGEEQENLLHAAAAKSLPISIKDGTVAVAGKSVPIQDKGIMYIFPSPFAETEKHSIVICAGLPYGSEVEPNHKLDLVPDFILYDKQIDGDQTHTNHAACAGFFDGNWKLDPKLTWWAE